MSENKSVQPTATVESNESAVSVAPKKKIYCFNNGGQPGLLLAMAMCEDGHVLAEHACSHEGYMAHDLGMVGTWKHENYDAHCGAGNWELVWIDRPLKKHGGLMVAYKLNQERGRIAKPEARKSAALSDQHGSEAEGSANA